MAEKAQIADRPEKDGQNCNSISQHERNPEAESLEQAGIGKCFQRRRTVRREGGISGAAERDTKQRNHQYQVECENSSAEKRTEEAEPDNLHQEEYEADHGGGAEREPTPSRCGVANRRRGALRRFRLLR